ncbi:protein dispatched homolog 3-like isoform X2 [Strongylocentrotus purpuratus]|uniref:SSD domain-containing protein n=1 Tax=Strongylocentrotus purpuratus TaxID=7668 RepID=A0A7M7SZL7_STRPU|nr:protein dispatched homolog 3-like isoform X2 [Strongylocentrotus purpuratus]
MVGQLRFKPHIDHWEGDDEVTFYAANVQRPCDLSDLAVASSSSSSSSNSSSSDLSGSGDGLQNSNAANEVLDALRSRSDSCTFSESKDVKVHPFMLRIGKIISNVPFSVGTLVTVSAVSFLLGTLAVMVVKPSPQWDKSLNAFQIPNHLSTLKREMLELAQKDNHVPKRPRRSTFEPPARLGELDLKDSTIKEYEIDFKHMSNVHKRHIKTKLSYRKEAGVDLPENSFNPIHSDHLLNINKKLVHRNQQLIKDNNQLVQKDKKLQVHSANQNTNSANKRSSSVSNSSTVKEDTQGHSIKRRSAGLVPQAHSWRLQLVYMAKGEDENIFTPERLQTIHDIEMDIMKQPGFTRFCSRSSHSIDDPALARFGHCLPPNSLMTYFFPTQVGDMIRYDGMGTELADINGTLKMAMNHQTFYWFVDTHMNSTTRRSKFIRTEIWFGRPHDNMTRSQAYEEYKKFIFTYIKLLDTKSTDKVDVLYGGTEIFDQEVSMTIYHDILLSIPTFVAIFVLLFVFTSFSLWLTICGLLSIIYSFCLAYFCYHVFFGIEALGLLNVVSVFVIIGIGVDDVFVFVNTFRQADSIKDPALRMAHTITTAGGATFFTSITTAGAFGANMASQIPAIYDFGLFMMLLVVFCWLMVVMIMPSALNIWSHALNCELSLMQKFKNRKSGSPSRHHDTSLYRVLAQYENQSETRLPALEPCRQGVNEVPENHVLDDSDIPLLDLEDEPAEHGLLTDDEDDIPLLEITSIPALVPPRDTKESASLTAALQKMLHTFIAKPVMKARWVFIGIFCIIFCVTIVLVSRIKPASRPPALYQPNTNLQRLLDLAYNFSGKDIRCTDCSGFDQGDLHPVIPIPNVPVEVPGMLSPNPVLPTHRPETTLWPPSEPPMIPTDAGGGGDGGVGGDGDGGGGGGGTVVTILGPPGHQTPLTTTSYSGNSPTPPPKSPPIIPPTTEPHGRGDVDPSSPGKGYDPCANNVKCGNAASRPVLDDTAMVFLVFGIKGINKTNVSTHHVLNEDKGTVIYDLDFTPLRSKTVGALCKICKLIGNNQDLVRNGGAECFPTQYLTTLRIYGLRLPDECNDIPRPKLIAGQRSHAKVHMIGQELVWFAMAFESKIFEGKSSFEAYKDYNAWEKAIVKMKANLTEEERVGLMSVFQTCDYWEQVFMEIIGVTSAIYGVAFSLIVCVIAVALFTAHITILLIAFLTIAGVILVVVSMFYLLGWQMGAVEAVSLSILVGSSIDYCIHLVEGYRVAGCQVKMDSGKSARQIRQQRTIHSISTIGVSILSSALTTIIAAIPLCFTTIQLFAKFGQIVALNTLVSIIYTLTSCTAFLGCFAPARYKWNLRGLLLTLVIVGLVLGAGVVALFVMHHHGITIPGPSGDTLFG